MKRLVLDIETAPLVAYTWSMYPKYIPMDHLVEHARTLMVGYKWLPQNGEEAADTTVITESADGQNGMLRKVHTLINEADAVIHYNGTRFDIPHLYRGFLEQGLGMPSPIQEIDLFRTVKQRFNFPSNRLDYVCQRLGLGRKSSTGGMALWKNVMAGQAAAIKSMASYCKNDVNLTAKLYDRLLPWIPNHANFGLYVNADNPVCPKCGSTHLQRRGYSMTRVMRYARYQCQDCGSWSRGRTAEGEREHVLAVAR